MTNESVSLIVGYEDVIRTPSLILGIDSLLNGLVEVQVLERGKSKPIWTLDRKEISNYKIIKESDDILFNTNKTPFFLIGYYTSGKGF